MNKISTVNPLHKKCIDAAMARLDFVRRQFESLELAKLVVMLYRNEFNHIGEQYETNHHSS